MERNSPAYQAYTAILRRELICAMGCTEPIAISYCAAHARSLLGTLPDRVEIAASSGIIKNVKSVVVPNTNGQRGIAAAAAVGILGGDEDAELLVISNVSEQTKAQLPAYMNRTEFSVSALDSVYLLDAVVTVHSGSSYAKVRIAQEHTNIVWMERDGEVLLQKDPGAPEDGGADGTDYSLLTVAGVCDFAQTCDLADVQDVLQRQIDCNSAIADEGLRHDYGANIGKVLLKSDPDSVRTRARARAAAGSDARMSGCELPVIINSGSGNQGMTASLPVIEYAQSLHADREHLLRALLVSNLITIHAKTSIGRLSAYCGAISAGAGAGAGIAYLQGGDCDVISHTIVNALAVSSGIVCDGAKPSCAAKIAIAVETGILGYEMYRCGQQFYGGDGLVRKGVENSIASFGRLGRVGMRETDLEICRMMTED